MKNHNSKELSVFLADDDDDDREIFEDIIHQVNGPINFFGLKNGTELILKLKETLPDLIFLDLNMPGMDGRECLVEMKSNKQLEKLKVIICSTSASPEDISYAYNQGADLYIIKPNKFNQYFSVLKDVLNLFVDQKLPIKDRNKFVWGSKI